VLCLADEDGPPECGKHPDGPNPVKELRFMSELIQQSTPPPEGDPPGPPYPLGRPRRFPVYPLLMHFTEKGHRTALEGLGQMLYDMTWPWRRRAGPPGRSLPPVPGCAPWRPTSGTLKASSGRSERSRRTSPWIPRTNGSPSWP
jgi:hypothetical protein